MARPRAVATTTRPTFLKSLLRNVYLVPFHAAEKAGAASFMSAYMDLNDVPATGNRWLLTTSAQGMGFQRFRGL